MTNHYKNLKQYNVFEINRVMDNLRSRFDIVRLVDAEECRVLDIDQNGDICYGDPCFNIWNRKNRCADCSSLRACMTHIQTDKIEHLGLNRERIHSIPVYLEMKDGELELCVIECVSFVGKEDEQYQAGEPKEFVSTHDVLTRVFTQEKLFRQIRSNLRNDPDGNYCIVIINIRNFKVINRLFGVDSGNRLLTGIADILRKNFTGDEAYGRVRDDRFVLFIRRENLHPEALLKDLETICDNVGSPIYSVQIKLGIFEIENKNIPVAAMIDHAEIAVNNIRYSREERISTYDPSMLEQRMKDQHIVADFESALRDGEFRIFLQPQVREDGLIVGGEALVRWIRSDNTVLMPGEFLHVLHHSELLSHLDLYIWDRAAQLISQWKQTPLKDLYISINVDPSDFFFLDVPKELRSLCRKYDIDPEKLRVEITETALVEETQRQNNMVERLQDEGFIVEIDDFGKGSSSLSLLKNIHANVLKIDMGFVQGEQNHQRSEVILGSVIEMAENLDMDVITEGVETREQVEKLVGLGCRNFQGFYYSRPLPVSDFELIVQEARADQCNRKECVK